MQRPIFDKAIYGCVRFHHRSVREYLTAQWLHRLLLNEKSRREIESLFFKVLYGRTVLIPSMRPILSWLILFDDGILEKAAEIAPEICLEGGDPSALPKALRSHLLEKFCRHYANQTRWGFSFDISEVRRFADPELGETIKSLLKTYRHHEEIRALLLRMVCQGEIEMCAETALEFALSEENNISTRSYGIQAVEAAASDDQKEKLVAEILSDKTMTDKALTGEVISAFAPDHLSTQDVLALIQRIDGPSEYSYSRLTTDLREYSEQRCPDNHLLMWCRGLLDLLEQPPFIERRHFEVSQKNWWLLSCAALAVERLVRMRHPDALNPSAIKITSLTQNAVHYHNYYSKEHKLDELVPEWTELNHALFWFSVIAERNRKTKENRGRVTNFWDVNILGHYWRLTENDFETVLSDINFKSYLDDRLVALSLAFQLYKKAGRGRVRRQALKKTVQGVPELEEKLHLLLHPPPMSEESKRYWREDANFKRQQKRREKKAATSRKKSCEWLKENTHVLRDTSTASSGSVQNGMVYLLHNLREKRDNNNNWAEPHWEALISEFGQEVAEAYRDGCVGYWRKYCPQIRSEGIEAPNSTPYAVIIGLSGIEIEARLVPNWPNNLSEKESEHVCRYALYELNGFPKWLSKLHAVFPNAVELTLLKEIAWEFSQFDGNDPCHYILSDVFYGPDWLKHKIAKQLISPLRDYEPKHDETLSHALGIMLGSPDIDKPAFIGVAKANLEKASSFSRKALWLASWMCLDANGALERLKSVLGILDNAEEATNFSILFIVGLFGNGRENIQHAHQNFIRPKILLSLIKSMHIHIRTSEDIDRVGTGVFTPGLRDNAQGARERLFNLLSKIPGKETYLAMLDLSAHADNQVNREWYAISAKRRAEADAEGMPWQPKDVADFAKNAERAPQNHRELFELSVSRLLDLKADLEEGDTSNAGLLQKVEHENELRNYIAGRIRDHSKGWYSIAQEDELADGKKPDIRINGSNFDSPVPIELKIAENWPGSVLFERLNNQLCGQYLRDIHSNCGIYLLVYRGQKKFWIHPKTNKHMDFNMLLESLETEVQDIVAKDDKIESLEIIGIDLSKRKSSKTNQT